MIVCSSRRRWPSTVGLRATRHNGLNRWLLFASSVTRPLAERLVLSLFSDLRRWACDGVLPGLCRTIRICRSSDRIAPRTKRPAVSRVAEPYQHTQQTPMRPEVGTQAQFKKRKAPKTYRYDSSLDPALSWDDGASRKDRSNPTITNRLLYTDGKESTDE